MVRRPSRYESTLARQIELSGLPAPESEYAFAKELKNERGHVRMFRFDFAWPELQVAAEVDGGRFMVRRNRQGRFVPVGYHGSEKDYEKLNFAALLGWRVLRFSPDMIRTGKALRMLKEVLMA